MIHSKNPVPLGTGFFYLLSFEIYYVGDIEESSFLKDQ